MGIVSEYDVDDDVQTQEELFVEFEATDEAEDTHCVSRDAALVYEWFARLASYGMEG